ncbi:MAG: DUF6512 family protein [Lutispora sp.]|nr:DUF6512 family protein [Lutispora sp.]MDD4835463.1 DUF6512 family protein [Lutispora sp.]
MDLRRKEVLKWQILSVLWVIIVGSVLHFTYEWSGNSPIVGAFSAVNESVWEHLKLGYWSMIFFCLIEYPFIKDYANNYFFAKAVGIFAMNLFIVLFFYSYTAMLGKHSLILDVIAYILGAVTYGVVSYRIMIKSFNRNLNVVGFILLVMFGSLFILFTYYPPHLPIFKDPQTGRYGTN